MRRKIKIQNNKKYIISNTTGRTGNNVYQLLEIMRQATKDNCIIDISKLTTLNNIIDIRAFENNFNEKKSSHNHKNNDFFPRNLHLPEKRTIDMREYFKMGKIIQPYLKIEEKLPEDVCVIHIRSGDEFSSYNRPSNYIQPPLAYYQFIIDNIKEDYKEILVVTEPDMINPVIKPLSEYNNKIKIISTSVSQDYCLLLRAQTVILSRSSFSDTSIFLNPNLKKLYFWSYNHCLMDTNVIPSNIQFFPIELTQKYITSEEWCSSKNQRQLMLDYNIENVNFK